MTKVAENDFLSAVGQVIQMQVQLAVTPLLQKIDFLENELKKMNDGWLHDMEAVRGVTNGKDGKDGKDGADCDMEAIVKRVDEFLLGVHSGVDGKDGKDAELDYEHINKAVSAAVTVYFHENPVQVKDGKDGRDGVDGKSLSLDELDPVIRDRVRDAVASLPLPRHVVSGHIDRGGVLHLVLSDGSKSEIGLVVGKDGTDGKDGAPGKDGRDGADGLGFDDMSMSFDGERDFVFKYQRGELVKEFAITVPFQLYRNVWKAGEYKRGDTVTREGSQWVALRDTDAMPGTLDSGWQLSVKRGRDGKDGVGEKGAKGDKGEPGRDGQDLTQLGPDGKKWG